MQIKNRVDLNKARDPDEPREFCEIFALPF